MSTVMKTPGVYIVEKNAFPNSVVEVATAVPAFIGYTERADNKGKTLRNVPWRISSMAEFRQYFGGPPPWSFEVRDAGAADPLFTQDDKKYVIAQADAPKGGNFTLYLSMLFFFQNGGGPCYVVSVGDYSAAVARKPLEDGLLPLIKEQEPTMVVVPEAVLLDAENCYGLQQAVLKHCGYEMRNRVAILDVANGWRDIRDPAGNCIADFRNGVGTNQLNYAAAYYPWLNTTLVQDTELSFQNVANRDQLAAVVRKDLGLGDAEPTDDKGKAYAGLVKGMAGTDPDNKMTPEQLHSSLFAVSPLYKAIMQEMKRQLNVMPPSAAMAGLYTMVDNTRGVWKAPANVSVNGVVSPTVSLSAAEQEDLNVTPQGKSINAIRSFIGEGVLVWGARTLDGNSLDWRYVNVRRTMIMLEESCRLAAKALVFEPNVASTWLTIRSMISNFLTNVWKRGGLAGAVPDDAFSVHVGLGETMTPEDILEGILRVTVLVAISRPAEFIEITFQQQMQKS
jgi:phage tail sheath protein FI